MPDPPDDEVVESHTKIEGEPHRDTIFSRLKSRLRNIIFRKVEEMLNIKVATEISIGTKLVLFQVFTDDCEHKYKQSEFSFKANMRTITKANLK